MRTLTKKMSYKKPEITGSTGNKMYFYNYDIKQETAEYKGNTQTYYTYYQITLDDKPTYEKCVETIIRKYISQSEEFDLINSANKDILLENKSSEAITEYKEYLALLESIKEKIKNDFNTLKDA